MYTTSLSIHFRVYKIRNMHLTHISEYSQRISNSNKNICNNDNRKNKNNSSNNNNIRIPVANLVRFFYGEIQDDSKLLSGFPWPIIFKPETIK